MSTVILSCSSLQSYVEEAQLSQKTDFPVIYLDKKNHVSPEKMRGCIIEAEKALPDSVDTVLVAMGFCGGSWEHVQFSRRVVIPRVDDCISLLLQTGDNYAPNLKQAGHIYMADKNPEDFNFDKMFSEPMDQFYGLTREELMHIFFDNYHWLDIVDTGLTDCYSEDYVEMAQKNADIMEADIDYVAGSNCMLHKLVSGKWDEQFVVAEPGRLIRQGDFFK